MKKKIITLIIFGALLLISIIEVSAIGIVNEVQTGDGNNVADTSTKITERFFFCRIESSGYGFCPIRVLPILASIYYDGIDPNATTTIKSFFGLRTLTIKGDHSLTIQYFRGDQALPLYYGDCSLSGRALIVEVTYLTWKQ